MKQLFLSDNATKSRSDVYFFILISLLLAFLALVGVQRGSLMVDTLNGQDVSSIRAHEWQRDVSDKFASTTYQEAEGIIYRTASFTHPAAVLAGATIALENMTKIPGTTLGFPANDIYSFHRNKTTTNTAGGTVKHHDTNVMRIRNTGTSTLVISNLAISNTSKFIITHLNGSAFTGNYPINVNAGGFVDVTLQFIDNSTSKGLKEATLTIHSNADNATTLTVLLKGTLMLKVEGGNEVTSIHIMKAFGFQTSMNGQPKPSSNWPTPADVDNGVHGDLILSKSFVQAIASQPVRAIQIAAFKGPGTAVAKLTKVNSSTVVGGFQFSFGTQWHQTLLPKSTNTSTIIANDFANTIGEPFHINIDGYSTNGGNASGQKVNEILGVRVYKVYDKNGQLIPYHYIVLQDYIMNGCGAGTANCDWNDNLYYFMNIKPATDPFIAGALNDVTVQKGVPFIYDASLAFDKGYAGNQLKYTAKLSNGNALPSWMSIDPASGHISGTPPTNTTSPLTVHVTATDLNGIVLFDANATGFQMQFSSTGGSTTAALEAECSQAIGTNWTIVNDATASGGAYVKAKPGFNSTTSVPAGVADRVSLSFNLASAGSYYIFARVKAPSSGDNSFWVKIDNGAWVEWSINNFTSVFDWRKVIGSPFNFTTGGTHTIHFAYREDGTYLDKLAVSASSTFPTGSGPAASPCGSGARLAEDVGKVKLLPQEVSKAENVGVYPNPGTALFELHLGPLVRKGKASVTVLNANGVVVKKLNYEEGLPEKVTLDLKEQANGLYLLQIESAGQTIIKRLIKSP